MSQAPRIPPSGNSVIDRQHARLNQLIHQAGHAARHGDDHRAFSESLRDFRESLADHFDVERLIISGAGFDAVPHHHEAHQAILQQLDLVLDAPGDFAGVAERHRVLEHFEHVLLEHEMVEDATYWDAVRAHEGNPHLRWRDMMAVGVDWIDEQHHRMVDLFNEMSDAARAELHDDCSRLLDGFIQFTRRHFEEEERHLEGLGGPIAAHRAEHARLPAQLQSLAAGGFSPAILVEHYLRFWMFEHILGLDRNQLRPATLPNRARS